MDEYWIVTMTDNFFRLLDSKYNRVYRGNYDEWKGVDLIMKNAEVCGKDCYFDRMTFKYCLYRCASAAVRKGTYDSRKDTFIIIMAAAFYVLEVKGTDRYIGPVLTVLSDLRDDVFFMRKKVWNEFVFTAAQIAGPQATAYALDKLDICQPSDSDDMKL